MIKLDPKNAAHAGKFICVYGSSGIGKTVTTLQTAPDDIYWLTFEPRDLMRSIEAAEKVEQFNEGKLKVAVYSTFMELMEFLDAVDEFSAFRTVFADGLSHFMNVAVTTEIKRENLDTKSKKPIMDMTKVEFQDRGEVNQAVFRVMSALGRLVALGKIVIVSCLESEKSKYKMGEWDMVAGPELGGREVPSNFPGFFDLIGRLTDHMHKPIEGAVRCPYCNDKTAGKVYPPVISFESDGNYLAKYTGVSGKRVGGLHWGRILRAIG